MAKALADQLDRLAVLQHERRPGVAQHVGGERKRQSGQPPNLVGRPVDAAQRRPLRQLPLATPLARGVQKREDVGRALPPIAAHDPLQLGHDQHVDEDARLAAAVADVAVGHHLPLQLIHIVERHPPGVEHEQQDVQHLEQPLRQPLAQPRREQPPRLLLRQSPLGGTGAAGAVALEGLAVGPGAQAGQGVAVGRPEVAQVEIRRLRFLVPLRQPQRVAVAPAAIDVAHPKPLPAVALKFLHLADATPIVLQRARAELPLQCLQRALHERSQNRFPCIPHALIFCFPSIITKKAGMAMPTAVGVNFHGQRRKFSRATREKTTGNKIYNDGQ